MPAPPTPNKSQSTEAHFFKVSDLVTQPVTLNKKDTNMTPKESCSPEDILRLLQDRSQLQMDIDIKAHKTLQKKYKAKKTSAKHLYCSYKRKSEPSES